MEATWNGALFSAATIRLPVSTQSSRRAFGKAVVQRRSSAARTERSGVMVGCNFMLCRICLLLND
ncbi:Hypothetical protein (plasmid) [Pseudomonas putida]|nr:Hypothetical protein [Pseudomonas putida]QIZ22786.1 Hypothetical protein [Pseudomonas putida]